MKILFHKLKDANIPFIAMSATFSADLRQQFCRQYDCSFDEQIWSEMDRRDICLTFETSSDIGNVSKSLLKKAATHLMDPKRKVIIIVYANSGKRVNKIEPMINVELEKYHTSEEDGTSFEPYAVTFTGPEGKNFKRYIIETFCNATSDSRALVSTSAGNCGINCGSCTCVLHDGPPTSRYDLSQKMGRSG